MESIHLLILILRRGPLMPVNFQVRLLVPGFVVASFGGLMVRRFDVWLVGWLGRLVG